jgi:hypothetical protein
MWGLLAALGIVGGLVKLAASEKSDAPVLRPALQKRRLSKILKKSKWRRLTLTEAEDGLVLSKRLGETGLEKWFGTEVQEARKRAKRSGGGGRRTGRGLDVAKKL